MIDVCVKWTALMNRPENKFRLWGRRKFNFWPNRTSQIRVQNTQSILGELLLVDYWRFKKESICSILSHILILLLLSYNPNILGKLNLVLTLSLIYPFLAFSEDHRPCFDTDRSVTPLLAQLMLPQLGGCVNCTFQDLLLYQ